MKKMFSLILAVIMAMSCMCMTSFAAEETTDEPILYSYEVTSDMLEEGVAVPFAIDQTFTMTTTHRGADRTYSGNTLRYAVTITDANGNAVDNQVRVDLHDYNSSVALQSCGIDADGYTHVFDVSITSGRVYYFKYTKIAGTTRTLRVNMYIYAY